MQAVEVGLKALMYLFQVVLGYHVTLLLLVHATRLLRSPGYVSTPLPSTVIRSSVTVGIGQYVLRSVLTPVPLLTLSLCAAIAYLFKTYERDHYKTTLPARSTHDGSIYTQFANMTLGQQKRSCS